jgi:hypothetical protein
VRSCSLTPNPQLEDHPVSAVRDCLFNILAATLHIWRPSPPSSNWGRAMSWWQGTHLTKYYSEKNYVICKMFYNFIVIYWLAIKQGEAIHVEPSTDASWQLYWQLQLGCRQFGLSLCLVFQRLRNTNCETRPHAITPLLCGIGLTFIWSIISPSITQCCGRLWGCGPLRTMLEQFQTAAACAQAVSAGKCYIPRAPIHSSVPRTLLQFSFC